MTSNVLHFLLFQEQTPSTSADGINHLDGQPAISPPLEKLYEDSFFVKELIKKDSVKTLKDIANEVDFTSLNRWTQASFWITIQVIAEIIPCRSLDKVPMEQLVHIQLFLDSTAIRGYLWDSFNNVLNYYLHSYGDIDIVTHILGTYMARIPDSQLVKELIDTLYFKTNLSPDKITALLCSPNSSHTGILRLGKCLRAHRRNVWHMLEHQFSEDDCETDCPMCNTKIDSEDDIFYGAAPTVLLLPCCDSLVHWHCLHWFIRHNPDYTCFNCNSTHVNVIFDPYIDDWGTQSGTGGIVTPAEPDE